MGRKLLGHYRSRHRNQLTTSNTDTRVKNPAAREHGPYQPPKVCHAPPGPGIIGGAPGAIIIQDITADVGDPTRKLITFDSRPENPAYAVGFAFTAHVETDLAPILFVSNNYMTVGSSVTVLPKVRWSEVVFDDGLGSTFSLFMRARLN